MIDGRTKTSTLVKISFRVEELLEAKPKDEVQKVEKAMQRYEELVEQCQEAAKQIGVEPPI